jgi:hypothetical protein
LMSADLILLAPDPTPDRELMNPYHDKNGRFTTEAGAVTFSTHGKSGKMGAIEGPQPAAAQSDLPPMITRQMQTWTTEALQQAYFSLRDGKGTTAALRNTIRQTLAERHATAPEAYEDYVKLFGAVVPASGSPSSAAAKPSVATRSAQARRVDIGKLARKKLPELRKRQAIIAQQQASAQEQWRNTTDPGIRQRLEAGMQNLDAMADDIIAAIDRVAFPNPPRR